MTLWLVSKIHNIIKIFASSNITIVNCWIGDDIKFYYFNFLEFTTLQSFFRYFITLMKITMYVVYYFNVALGENVWKIFSKIAWNSIIPRPSQIRTETRQNFCIYTIHWFYIPKFLIFILKNTYWFEKYIYPQLILQTYFFSHCFSGWKMPFSVVIGLLSSARKRKHVKS